MYYASGLSDRRVKMFRKGTLNPETGSRAQPYCIISQTKEFVNSTSHNFHLYSYLFSGIFGTIFLRGSKSLPKNHAYRCYVLRSPLYFSENSVIIYNGTGCRNASVINERKRGRFRPRTEQLYGRGKEQEKEYRSRGEEELFFRYEKG